jgi:hypothetical protein
VICDFLDRPEGLTSVLGIINMRNFPAIDLEVAFTPRRDVDFQPVIAEQREKLLNGCSFSDRQCLVSSPFQRS